MQCEAGGIRLKNILLYVDVHRNSLDMKLIYVFSILDALQMGATQFESQAGKLKRKMWWKNLKVSWLRENTLKIINSRCHNRNQFSFEP